MTTDLSRAQGWAHLGGTCTGGCWHPKCPKTMPPLLPSPWGFAQPLLVGDLPQEPFDSEQGTAARASSLPVQVSPSFCHKPPSGPPRPARWLSLTPSSGPPGGHRQADCVSRSQHSCWLYCAGAWEAARGFPEPCVFAHSTEPLSPDVRLLPYLSHLPRTVGTNKDFFNHPRSQGRGESQEEAGLMVAAADPWPGGHIPGMWQDCGRFEEFLRRTVSPGKAVEP